MDQKKVTIEQIAVNNNFLLNALLSTLIKKGVISKEDLDKTVKSMQETMQKQTEQKTE